MPGGVTTDLLYKQGIEGLKKGGVSQEKNFALAFESIAPILGGVQFVSDREVEKTFKFYQSNHKLEGKLAHDSGKVKQMPEGSASFEHKSGRAGSSEVKYSVLIGETKAAIVVERPGLGGNLPAAAKYTPSNDPSKPGANITCVSEATKRNANHVFDHLVKLTRYATFIREATEEGQLERNFDFTEEGQLERNFAFINELKGAQGELNPANIQASFEAFEREFGEFGNLFDGEVGTIIDMTVHERIEGLLAAAAAEYDRGGSPGQDSGIDLAAAELSEDELSDNELGPEHSVRADFSNARGEIGELRGRTPVTAVFRNVNPREVVGKHTEQLEQQANAAAAQDKGGTGR